MLFLFTVFLRAAQEVGPRVPASRGAPRHHALLRLDGRQVHPGGPQHVLRLPQHVRAHLDVPVLRGGRHGTPVPEVHHLEETSY